MLPQLCCLAALLVSLAGASQPVLPFVLPIDHDFETPPLPPAQKVNRTQVMESFHVVTDIRYRFATTQMSSVVRNINKKAEEIGFHVTLPKNAFIMAFHMMIDGKRYNGTVKERKAAKQEYQEAVDRGQSAGHVRQEARHANMFEVSVNVAAGSSVNFTLTYQEMLRRRLGVYEHELHIHPGQPVRDFRIETRIQENRPLRFVRTPALRKDYLLTNVVQGEKMNERTVVTRPTPQTATVLFEPDLELQGEDGGLQARFVVQYDVEHGGSGGDVLVVDGYFVHFLAPDHLSHTLPKDIIFVLDVSGSMSGDKIEQLRVAMTTILSDLKPKDRFNIITFSSGIHRWKEGLVSADEPTIEAAKAHVAQMVANGMTNINDALVQALTEMQARHNKERVGMIFFLTDGIPTEGETRPKSIASNVAAANDGSVAIFSLAFGDGADYDSLKSLSAQNHGFARKIYEASDADLQVATLYNEISAVSVKNMNISYQNSSVDEFSLTKTDFPIVFNGSEIIICGLLEDNTHTLRYEITGLESSGEINLHMEIDDIQATTLGGQVGSDKIFTGPRDFSGIVERMWAYMTVKQLLRQKERDSGDEDKVGALTKRILDLSLKYQLVTPLTSMVVTQPDRNATAVKESDADQIDIEPRRQKMMMTKSMSNRRYNPAIKAYRKSGAGGPQSVQYMPAFDPIGPFPQLPPMAMVPTPGRLNTRPRTTTTTAITSTPPTTAGPVKYSILNLVTLNLADRSTRGEPQPSVCMVPKRWKYRDVLLYSDINNTRIVLQQCRRKKCRKQPSLERIRFENERGVTAVDVVGMPHWQYGGGPFDVEVLSDSVLHVNGRGLKVIISVFRRGDVSYYSLRIRASKGQAGLTGGLLGHLASQPLDELKRLSRSRARKVCKAESADLSVLINKKNSRKFFVSRKKNRKGRKGRGRKPRV